MSRPITFVIYVDIEVYTLLKQMSSSKGVHSNPHFQNKACQNPLELRFKKAPSFKNQSKTVESCYYTHCNMYAYLGLDFKRNAKHLNI